MEFDGVIRVLGVDTALRCTGYGVIDSDGQQFVAVDCGVIRNTAKAPWSVCLRNLNGGMRELVDEYAPDMAALEGSFYSRNAKTAMILGMARGSVLAALATLETPVYEYAPRRVKQAVCGYGNASKVQVAALIAQMLNIDTEGIPDDATDALALAVCHAQTAFTSKGLYLPDPL